MNQTDKIHLSGLLQNHIENICRLQFPEYGKAKALCDYTQILANQYFSDYILYSIDLSEIKFTSDPSLQNDLLLWNQSHHRLLMIAHAMLSHTQNISPGLNSKKPNLQNQKFILICSLTLITLICLSICLWFFNYIVHWEWLSLHPKRISLYLIFQLLLLLISFFLITNNKKKQEIASIITGVIIAVIALV